MSSTVTWQEALLIAEKLSRIDQLRLVSELLQRIESRVVESEPIDLLDLAGVGADIWAKVDTNTYINEERDSWQS